MRDCRGGPRSLLGQYPPSEFVAYLVRMGFARFVKSLPLEYRPTFSRSGYVPLRNSKQLLEVLHSQLLPCWYHIFLSLGIDPVKGLLNMLGHFGRNSLRAIISSGRTVQVGKNINNNGNRCGHGVI